MQVKRIVAANMQQALRKVGQELGPDAAIISTKRVPEGMELIAAINYKSEEQISQAEIDRQLMLQEKIEAAKAHAKQRTQAPFTPAPAAPIAHAEPATVKKSSPIMTDKKNDDAFETMLAKMNQEMEQIRNQMVSFKGNVWDSARPMSWLQAQVWQRCCDMGIEEEWANELASRVPADMPIEDAWKRTLVQMERDIPVEYSPILAKGGCYMLVGATGAGKTTTLCKIAAKYAMHHGADKVAMITLDQYRLSAHDQLNAMGALMHIDTELACDVRSLEKLLKKYQHKGGGR